MRLACGFAAQSDANPGLHPISFGLLLLATAFTVWSPKLYAASGDACGMTTWNLIADQNKVIGSVTISNDQANLYVKYALDHPKASFDGFHLWAGNDISRLPSTHDSVGVYRPTPGQFPEYASASGRKSHTLIVPIDELSIADLNNACALPLSVVTHADVKLNGKTFAVWGGDISSGGAQPWLYGSYNLCCASMPPPQLGKCDSAFAKGGWVLTTRQEDNPDGMPSLVLADDNGGWAIQIMENGVSTYEIWKRVGLNDTRRGELVGDLEVSWDGTIVSVTTQLYRDVMKELHVYAGDAPPTTAAPGRYGYTQYFNPPVDTHTHKFAIGDMEDDCIWLIVHALSCEVIAER